MDQAKNSYAWEEAIELSLDLIRICEEFSDGDHNVLLGHLKNAVVDIPASVASDIKYSRGANLEPVIKLATELELVHRVYPAVDTGSAPEKVKSLLARMESNDFHEQIPTKPEPAPKPEEEPVEVKEAPKVEDAEEEHTEEPVEATEPTANEEPQPEPEKEADQEENHEKHNEPQEEEQASSPRLIQVNTDNS